MFTPDRTEYAIRVKLRGVYDHKKRQWITDAGNLPDDLVEIIPEGITFEERERFLRHELLERIIELRHELYQAREEARRARVEDQTEMVVTQAQRQREALAAITWATTLAEAQGLATQALRS